MATTEEQVSWNLSQKISEQIDTLLRGGRNDLINGKIMGCFYKFKEIRLLINYHLKPKQLKRVNWFEKEINDDSLRIAKQGNTEEVDEFEYAPGRREKDLKKIIIDLKNRRFLMVEKYRKTIMKYLDDYGYLMERKEDASHMM